MGEKGGGNYRGVKGTKKGEKEGEKEKKKKIEPKEVIFFFPPLSLGTRASLPRRGRKVGDLRDS